MSNARKIIGEYFKNVYPEHIRKNFAAWLKFPKDVKEKDEALQDVWNTLEAEADASTEKSFRKLQARIFSPTNISARKIFNLSIRILSRVAAVLLLPLLSIAATYIYMKKDAVAMGDVKLVEYIVPNGEIRNIVLPDSSQVRLNAGSILVYPQRFTGKTRTVYLNGEAYFNVFRNEKQVFTVITADMEVEVLGTVFNVSSYTDSKNSSATLERGKVNVRFKNTNYQDVMLNPNERILYDRNSGLVEKQTIKVENVVAWTKGNIVLQGMTIEEIAKIVERKYGINVYLNSHKYRNERITMKSDGAEGVAELMNILCHLIPGLRYQLENDKLYIY
jgi:ferric-dicitrate binding protein FerR (iron transport regulator)